MAEVRIPLPPRFATECLMGLLYHIDPAYTITLSAGEATVEGPHPKRALRDVLELAAQVLEERAQAGLRVELGLSGNDRKYHGQIWKALSLPPDATPVEMVRILASNPLVDAGKVKLLSALKPEYYEYNRIPGYAGSENVRKAGEEYPINVVAMCLTGYLLCRVGAARLERGMTVSVVLAPVLAGRGLAVDPDYRLTLFATPLRRLSTSLLGRKGLLAGLFPETALALLLASRMGSSLFRLYAIKEAKGQEPATVFAAMQMNLVPLREAMERMGLTEDRYAELVERLAERSMNVNVQGVEKTLATRFSSLLYEVLSRTRPPEEFVSVVNREYVSLTLPRSASRRRYDEDSRMEKMVESVVYLANRIWKAVIRGEFS
ncbi:hypothetical protein HRbin02_01419 [Candidatus Calditenuaceae archaeon HR02]|nr:hypothetical protein HRbin02_01419 [Candidatus Calditenuaceae archaeon HR02]